MKSSYNFEYNCSSLVSCQPYIYYASPGNYILEVWGAQGGNHSESLQGGKGGFSRGIIHFEHQTVLYIYIGGGGFGGAVSGFTECAYNGGGRGNYDSSTSNAASGGGGTDIRLFNNLESRIIVAGGGGGAAKYGSVENIGGCGGGYVGGDGLKAVSDGEFPGGGGGGVSEGGIGIGQRSGDFGYGGNQTGSGNYGSGGGGGFYGGGAGERRGATGGGGSGFVHTSFLSGKSISGCQSIPDFYSGYETVGNTGNGKARITLILHDCSPVGCVLKIRPLAFVLLIVLSIVSTKL